MPHFPWVYRHVPDDGLAWFICFVATLSVLTPWAFVTYRLIEQPGIRLGSRLIKSLERPTTVGEPSVIVGK
jgi:peptidoglycan/LPS O-acetylase OafA/YrhL